MFLYDTHVHTSEASPCGHNSAIKQVRLAKKRGCTGIIITDHIVQGYANCDENIPWEQRVRFQLSSYEKAKAEGKKRGLDVFLGWEYTHWSLISGVDILTYGLDEKFLLALPKLFTFNLEEYSHQVRKHGGYLAQAHPYRNLVNRAFEQKNFSPKLFDGAEVYNGSDSEEANAMGYDYAQKYNLPMQAGSDSHGVGHPATGGVVLEERAESIFDIINAIKSGKAKVVTT